MATKDTQSLSSDQKGPNHPPNDQMEKISERLRRQGYKVTEEYAPDDSLIKRTKEYPPKKTVSDWITLSAQVLAALAVIVSISALALGAYQFKEQLTASAHMQATQLAASAMQTLDQQRQTTLDTYLDRMQELLLQKPDDFKTYKPGDEYQAIAQARTLTAVRNLDGVRKATLIRFLWEAGLINRSSPIISLSGANLSGANFSGGAGGGAYAQFAPIVTVDLQDINLSGAILDGANLSGADLKGADLSGAIFNTKKEQSKDAQGNPLTLQPTQWPKGFGPKAAEAAGAICDDC